MGQYHDEDEALIGLARQLTDAYGEARTRDDQDYACDEIAAFLAAQRLDAPTEALVAIFDLPLTAETYPLVDETQSTLARRGPAVVERLLSAALGDVYDPDGPAPERAAETLDLMDRREAAQGLTEVLCGGGDDQLKGAAVDALVALGAVAEPDLSVALGDLTGGEWAQAALEQIRFEREHPDAIVDENGDEWDDDEDLDGDAPADDDTEGVEPDDGAGDETEADDDPGPATGGRPAGPDQDLVDGAYDDFLRRFEREAGGGAVGEPGSASGDVSGEEPTS